MIGICTMHIILNTVSGFSEVTLFTVLYTFSRYFFPRLYVCIKFQKDWSINKLLCFHPNPSPRALIRQEYFTGCSFLLLINPIYKSLAQIRSSGHKSMSIYRFSSHWAITRLANHQSRPQSSDVQLSQRLTPWKCRGLPETRHASLYYATKGFKGISAICYRGAKGNHCNILQRGLMVSDGRSNNVHNDARHSPLLICPNESIVFFFSTTILSKRLDTEENMLGILLSRLFFTIQFAWVKAWISWC